MNRQPPRFTRTDPPCAYTTLVRAAGGGRGAAYGDALGRILERAGNVVHREYYLNDRGVQRSLFGASLAARKAGTEMPEDGYVGEYIREWAAEMPDDVEDRKSVV